MSRNFKIALAVGIGVLVAADWITKLWIAGALALGESVALIDGWLYFVHRKNPGVAFSLFNDLADPWRVPLLSALSIVGVVLFARIIAETSDLISRAAAAMVIAGALGNLGDRLVNGHVTDFVLVRFFPFVFNLADAAITVGGCLLAVRMLRAAPAPAPEPVAATESH